MKRYSGMFFAAVMFGAVAITGTISGCGQGVDPLVLFDEALPQLDPIVQGGIGANFITSAYTATTPYWTLNSALAGTGVFVAPATGVVTEIGVDSVTLMHSGRMKTRIVGLSAINIRLGDTVVRGQSLAQFFLTNGVLQFWVLIDGNPVCPMSFLSPGFRQSLVSVTFNPCN